VSRRLKFVRGTVLGLGHQVEPGEEAEIADEHQAVYWVKQGRAVFVDGTSVPDDPGRIQAPEGPKPKAARTR
jgi:hypothetical protein